ncbi:unnamed protein product [Mycena citricolor]|uniref:Uncharacterized protein n=1 Tax=Mycena citricolor TaxID=2018698 RepID=A0AAD2HLT9_9AGAR|nr:unnamed protein product [Mycena citricolor]
MSGADDVAGACCGLCCLCGYGGLATWCNGAGLGGRGGRGCCGSCCGRSFNDDSMDRWDKDMARLRTDKPETSQPAAASPMALPRQSTERPGSPVERADATGPTSHAPA